MNYPALDVRGADPDIVLAIVDDFSPTAVEELGDGISVFFNARERRDAAQTAVSSALPGAHLAAREVDDGDWARRSQENLKPITVGAITVTPPWSASTSTSALTIVIVPSMGFGTGHHATTRLCLSAMQSLDLRGRRVLDVGTGSGVLAIAASRLGAREALGIDFDPDAITSARENLDVNPEARSVRFEVIDVRDAALPASDVVFANLTGAVLVQNAQLLASAVAPGGTLIVSGVQTHEREDVLAAFPGGALSWSGEESGWVALAFNFRGGSAV